MTGRPRVFPSFSLVGFAVAVLLPAACNRTEEPNPAPQKAPATASPSAAPTTLLWDAPSGWTRADNTSAVRKATYRVPKQVDDNEPSELAVSVAGGTLDANINRWIDQFESGAGATLKKTTRKVGGYDVTVVELSGTYLGNMAPNGPATATKPGFALLGAIVPVSRDGWWFFKLIGPARSVAAARPEFDSLVSSIRPQQ